MSIKDYFGNDVRVMMKEKMQEMELLMTADVFNLKANDSEFNHQFNLCNDLMALKKLLVSYFKYLSKRLFYPDLEYADEKDCFEE